MIEQKVSSRYAKALLETATKEGIAESVNNDFSIIMDLIHSSKQLNTLIKSPVVQFWKKKNIFTVIFEPYVSELTLNFIMLLADHRREALLSSISHQYTIQYNKMVGNLPVRILSAVELKDDTKKTIIDKLTNYSKLNVIADFKIDASIKGGIIIKIDDWVFDASIKNQLKLMFRQLSVGQAISIN